ncbi:hypothetical protein [Staphylococcus nepalensis]|uniref:hypothetical protein n=1 Tax=Staphylococcus nepalensis TaxID=214473 RepID=UPI003908392B
MFRRVLDCNTLHCFSIYNIHKVSVPDATMFFYLTPAVFLVLAYLLLEEITSIIGGVIILIGTTITSNYSKESI